jgi:Mg2+ and Co2+ transporter CorA
VEAGARWIDLLDPSADELSNALPALDAEAIELLAARQVPDHTPRLLLESHGAYLVGVLVDARPVPEEDRTSYREVDVVVAPKLLVTVRKSPPDGLPWQPDALDAASGRGASVAELLHRVLDDIAESYLDVVDVTYEEIEELEDRIDDWPSSRVRRRIADLRRDLLQARRVVAAMRGAVRRIIDGRLEPGGERLTREVELLFADTYETTVRAAEELDVARDLLGGAREYHQSVVAENQSDIVKKLTVIASLLLTPTLIVGFYGQNFAEAFKEPYWTIGVSSALIAVTALAQLAFFKWRRWI